MAAQVLKEKRQLYIRSVCQGIINGSLDELLQKKVLNQEEMENIRFENATVMEKARALIDSLIRKGNRACQIYISYICEEDPHLAETLGISSGPQSENSQNTQEDRALVPTSSALQAVQDTPPALTYPEPGGSVKPCSQEVYQLIKKGSTEIYEIKEKPGRTRLALIICNIEFDHFSRREGAEVDISNMKTLLENLGYSVDVIRNRTASEMQTDLATFAARPEHQKSDSTFLVFMSHGIRAGICGTKYSEEVPDILDVDIIFRTFNTVNCPNLKDKPKVIIIQACRGEGRGEVWVKDSAGASENSYSLSLEDLEDDAIKKAHKEKDFIAFCSSTPDNVSWRHPTKGSLFIMRLIKNLQDYAYCCDLEDIFRKVRLSFEQPMGKIQMPTTERVTLTRRFYLFPGH